ELRQIHDVDPPEPRDQVATKGLPEFSRLRAQVHGSIKRG
ncbi:MAG: hypothetical protein QOD76_1966, partial [Solirubrobacteraceae bacterium]|nr:hypothetical protein [Solirubrobacteraceae bacterium]